MCGSRSGIRHDIEFQTFVISILMNCHVLTLTIAYVPKLTEDVPNLTGYPNVPKIESPCALNMYLFHNALHALNLKTIYLSLFLLWC